MNSEMCNCPPPEQCPDRVNVALSGAIFTVTFEGVSNEGLTWRYSVRNVLGHNLETFDMQICPQAQVTNWRIYSFCPITNQCQAILASGTGPGRFFQFLPDGDPSIPCTGETPVISFRNLCDLGGLNNFCFEFTLDRCYLRECVSIGLEAGTTSNCAFIQGPSPTCRPCVVPPPPPPTPTRGLPVFRKK